MLISQQKMTGIAANLAVVVVKNTSIVCETKLIFPHLTRNTEQH
jgi:hypothetical protein